LGSTAAELLIGSLLGLVAGVGLTALTYLGQVAIPRRRLFAVTTTSCLAIWRQFDFCIQFSILDSGQAFIFSGTHR
jgi:hypothetical protein